MPHHLVIVESPSKARTLARFLGSSYTIKASMGHIRDLPKSKLGVDVEDGFKPDYQVIKGKEKQIKELKDAAKKADVVLLAADPDREGEAIAWHLAETLKLRDPERIVFHEVTKSAVEEALASPRKINRALVAAQEARRVIDRLVGYQISPLLWRKVRTGLSAGRVQSVAVRLVVDREREIEAFVAEESWTVDLHGNTAKDEDVVARLHARSQSPSDKLELGTASDVDAVLRDLGANAEGVPEKATSLTVVSVDQTDVTRNAPNPYTTSTMQQDASTRLRFSPKRTMMLAQELYEGVDLGSSGSTGLITYMRTDSTRIADSAKDAAAAFIRESFGEKYLRTSAAKAKTTPGGQDAHEAIRPTDVSRTPESVASSLNSSQAKLYELIWRRFTASQMAPAKFRRTAAIIRGASYDFRASGTVPTFDGFNKVWKRDEERDEVILPPLAVDDVITAINFESVQHFTSPPPRYTEASLIKDLEERGIGRPSTYAPTVDVIEDRGYVRQEERRLHPTEVGKTVDGVLREHFPDIVDIDFTAALEKRLDGIEEGTRPYEKTVNEWYEPFALSVAKAETEMQRVKIPAKETGETCPLCNEGQLVIREGKYGPFTGCSRYPECTYIKGKEGSGEELGEPCPECGKPLVTRKGKRGPFVGCTGYPTCHYVRQATPAEGVAAPAPAAAQETGEKCPDCGKPLVERSGRFGPFVSCSGYPTCKYRPPKAPREPKAAVPAAKARKATKTPAS